MVTKVSHSLIQTGAHQRSEHISYYAYVMAFVLSGLFLGFLTRDISQF